jgi:hypothetical protein
LNPEPVTGDTKKQHRQSGKSFPGRPGPEDCEIRYFYQSIDERNVFPGTRGAGKLFSVGAPNWTCYVWRL